MNKKLYVLFAILTLICCAFYSCDNDSDDNYNGSSYEWITFNDSIYDVIKDSAKVNEANSSPNPLLYKSMDCLTKNGKLYYKTIDEFIITPPPTKSFGIRPKISENGNPTFYDSVVVRYEGFYYYKDIKTGEVKKHIFDSTEKNNQQQGKGFTVKDFYEAGAVKGFGSIIQNMKVKEQVQVCIPYNLAYGEYNNYDNYGTLIIPGHTTLFFKILLLKIYPINPNEYPDVETGQ